MQLEKMLQLPTWFHPLRSAVFWLRVLGVLSLAAGALYVLTLWGVLFAWVAVWVGVLALQAADSLNKAFQQGSHPWARQGLDELCLAIRILGIFMLVNIIAVVLAAVAVFVLSLIYGPEIIQIVRAFVRL